MKNFNYSTMHGIYPAALTMFDEKGNLDEQATWNHADWLIRQGVHGLVAAGTSGEFIALTDDERKRVIEIILDAARDRVPVIAHTGYYSTLQTIEMTRWASSAGADAALLILPYYQKPDKPSVLRHFRMVRESTGLPLLAYNNPANSACEELKPWEMADLAHDGIIQGVKSTMAISTPVVDLKIQAPQDFRVFYGSFLAALQGLAAGADGWISGILNFLPAEAVDLYNACCVTKDLDRARKIWYRIAQFGNLYFRPRHGPAADLPLWRAGLELRGQHGGFSRPPFFPITPEQREDLRQVMVQTGIL